MARSVEDALRSTGKYVWEALGGVPWTWGISRGSHEQTFTRPFILVATAGGVLHADTPRHFSSFVQPMVVHCYPARPADSEEDSVAAALMRHEQLRELLWATFEFGQGLGVKRRVPMFDFDGIPLPSDSPYRKRNDFYRVDDLSIDPVASPEDPRDIATVVNLRASWERLTLAIEGRVVQSMTVRVRAGSPPVGRSMSLPYRVYP